MAAFIEERKMSRKKSNRLSLEQHKRTYRENQAAIAKALEQNAELEKAITEEENLEIVRMVKAVRMDKRELEAFLKAYASGRIELPEDMQPADEPETEEGEDEA